jgi:hypothetical protein
LVIDLDYENSSAVQRAFEEVEIDYLFLIPSKSEERALEAKRFEERMSDVVTYHISNINMSDLGQKHKCLGIYIYTHLYK